MDMASVHKYPIKMITDNGTFKKLSLEWNFLKMLLSCVRQTIGSNPVHANNSEYVCVKRGKLGYCLKVIIFKSIPCVHVDGENNAFDVNLDLFQHNSHVDDLFTDLSDGRLLISLLEIISGEKLGKIGKTANF